MDGDLLSIKGSGAAILTIILFPIILNVISNYVYDKIKYAGPAIANPAFIVHVCVSFFASLLCVFVVHVVVILYPGLTSRHIKQSDMSIVFQFSVAAPLCSIIGATFVKRRGLSRSFVVGVFASFVAALWAIFIWALLLPFYGYLIRNFA